MPMIDPAKVVETIRYCLFDDGEDHSDAVIVKGITTTFGLHPGRLEEKRGVIEGMLSCLPDSFKKSGGGGMSFLEACNDSSGEQWTGMHQHMQELFVLGMAIGKAEYCLPREVWSVLPGGMPYIMVDL